MHTFEYMKILGTLFQGKIDKNYTAYIDHKYIMNQLSYIIYVYEKG